MAEKPLGHKAYGSIGHLPGRRLGPSDSSVPQGQADICTVKVRDKHDIVSVEVKYDGSCCSVANVDGRIVALTRAGYPASSSRYEQHWLFAAWVLEELDQFESLLTPGERVVGEWIAQAHGTLYRADSPFIAFDIFDERNERITRNDFWARIFYGTRLRRAQCVHKGNKPISVEDAFSLIDTSIEPFCQKHEGLVYRVERHGTVDFLAKWVRPDKEDGCYLPEISGCPAVWNWGPKRETS